MATQEAVAAEPRAEARPKTKGGFRLSTFSSLQYRDYRLLFFTVVCTSGGQWMESIALGWLAYEMTGSAFMLGAINGVRALPFLLLGPWGGVAADRVDRKKLMLFSQLWVMMLAVVLTVLIATNLIQVWHLFAFTLLSGVGWVFTQPVRQTLIPSFVPRENLANAVALQSAGFNATRIIGPSMAGVLIASVGPEGAFAFKSVLYFAILALTMRMTIPPLAKSETRSSPGRSLIEGFQYIWANPTVLWLIILALIPMLLAFPLQSLMPVFAKDVLLQGPEGYGMLVSFMGIGAFTGTITVASLGNFQRKGLLLLLSVVGLGVAMILFARSTWMPASMVLLMFVGGFQMTFMSMNNTLLHLNITDEVRGRVMSIYMLDQGLTPLGTLFAGSLASVAGAPTAATVIGITCLVLSLIALKQVTQVRRLT